MRVGSVGMAVFTVLATLAQAGPNTITYQGSVLDPSGGPVANGTYKMQFKLADDATAGSMRWAETKDVLVMRGFFSVILGETTPLHPVFTSTPDLWLEVTVDLNHSGTFEASEVYHPRQRMNGAPWAHPRLVPDDRCPNLIGGHANNATSEGVVGVTIAGGGDEDYPNRATEDFATIGGGMRNQAGDEDTRTSQRGQTVGGGIRNRAIGHGTTISGGRENTAEGELGTIGGGMWNKANGDMSTIPGGQAAEAALYGQLAYASGSFAQAGMAQHSLYVLRRTTSDSSVRTLALDGFSRRLTVSDGRTLTFNALVVARSDTGQSGGASIMGVIENEGGTTQMVGTPVVLPLASDNPAWSVTVEANDTEDSLDFKVRGASATSIRWVATVRTAEVAW